MQQNYQSRTSEALPMMLQHLEALKMLFARLGLNELA
jgi:hypothetical protein